MVPEETGPSDVLAQTFPGPPPAGGVSKAPLGLSLPTLPSPPRPSAPRLSQQPGYVRGRGPAETASWAPGLAHTWLCSLLAAALTWGKERLL